MDAGTQAFLDTWNSLPADYVPQWSFAYSENDGGLYAYPATEATKQQYRARFDHTPVLRNYAQEENPITSQGLATGQVPGAVRIDGGGNYGATIDPKYAQDLRLFNDQIAAGNATDDSFQGLTANLFGNTFTLPALFASAAMGANAFTGISQPGSLASDASFLTGGSGEETLLGATAGDTLGTGTLSTLGTDAAAWGGTGLTSPAVAASSGGLLSTLGAVAPYAPLISTGIGAIGAIVGGVQGANAARDAADTQADAAREANNTLLQINAQNRADLAPYRAAGTAALGQLQTLTNTPLTYGPYTAPAPLDPASRAFDPARHAFTGTPALDPSGYAFTPPSGQQVLNEDPGYAFRVSEGQKALERSAAGKGLLLSGGQLKDLTRFGQGQAAQEYQAAYGRRLGQNELAYGRGLTQNQDLFTRGLTTNQLAYDRDLQGNQLAYGRDLQQNQDAYARGRDMYSTNFGTLTSLRNAQYNELAGLSGTGQTAVNAANTLNANTGTQLAANTTSAGAATAAGQVGAQNQLNGIFTGVGNAGNQYLQYQLLSSLLSRKAA